MKTKLFTTALVIFFSAFMLAAANTAKGKEARLASSLENAMDPSVKVENWMFNDAFWNMEATTHFTQDFDASLALENWMSDVETWDAFSLAMAETDETLKLEDWMTNDNLWITEAVFTENEEALQLEDWMTNDKMWISEEILQTATDEKLVIESWMTDEKYWNLPEGR